MKQIVVRHAESIVSVVGDGDELFANVFNTDIHAPVSGWVS